MTLVQLRTIVEGTTGRTDKDTLIDASINFALITLSQSYNFLDLQREFDTWVAGGDYKMELPMNLNQIQELRFLVPASPTVSYPMKLERKLWVVEKFPNIAGSSITGRPLWCYREGNQLFFDRKCNGVYCVRITGDVVASYFAEADECPIKNAEECLVAYATAEVYRAIQLYTDAGQWMQKWTLLRTNLINAKQRETGTQFVAEPWSRDRRPQTNEPWLDPFQGLSNQYR